MPRRVSTATIARRYAALARMSSIGSGGGCGQLGGASAPLQATCLRPAPLRPPARAAASGRPRRGRWPIRDGRPRTKDQLHPSAFLLHPSTSIHCCAHHRDVAHLRSSQLTEGAACADRRGGQMDGGEEFARPQRRFARSEEELGDWHATSAARPEELEHRIQTVERRRRVGGGAGVADVAADASRGCEADRRPPRCMLAPTNRSAAAPAGGAPPDSWYMPRRRPANPARPAGCRASPAAPSDRSRAQAGRIRRACGSADRCRP